MKDSEFTELLNLYLDHEISAADAARLEAEVQGNPARRRVYEDYCRMQKACKMLAQDFASEPAETVDRKIVAFEAAGAARGRRRVYVASSLAAAAACVALVFVNRAGNDTPTIPTAEVVQSVATPPSGAAPETVPPTQFVAATQAPAQQPFSLRRQAQQDALSIAAQVQLDPQLAWLNDVRMTPIQMPLPVEQLRFDASATQRLQDRVYTTGNKQLPADVQWTAIRFQK